VLGEYLFGVWKSIHRKRYEEWLGANESLFRILAVRQATARHYAAIRFELKEAGRPIPTNDLWIAALCREYRSKLVSRDRHFAAVTGLTVVVW
jgi:predicted nucleic acid-binding protein